MACRQAAASAQGGSLGLQTLRSFLASPVQFIDGVYKEFPNFFQLPVLMLMLITLLNDGTLISVGYDNVRHSPRPGERGC